MSLSRTMKYIEDNKDEYLTRLLEGEKSMGLTPERLREITEAYYSDDDSFKEGMIVELINGVNVLREGFEWIKYGENDFYNQVSETELGEIRRLDTRLKPWANQIQVIFATVNESLNPKY
ncbi:hypothetical protein [Paenibacillus sp. QZ-Y1]|uniref:hypothetical protein n=1 Tax=Paenibacillus sp. QZ-Y1 TaxID=3414511 RepID=UPI003F7969D3